MSIHFARLCEVVHVQQCIIYMYMNGHLWFLGKSLEQTVRVVLCGGYALRDVCGFKNHIKA